MPEYTWACHTGETPAECARNCRPAYRAAMKAAVWGACASVGIEHGMDTADVYAAYMAGRERLNADPAGLAGYRAETRERAELDVEVRDE